MWTILLLQGLFSILRSDTRSLRCRVNFFRCDPTSRASLRHFPSPHDPPFPARPRRFKGKRVYPSVPNQPSEAGAHFMFELAKSVLAKAGGNSSTSLFTQVGGGDVAVFRGR